MQLNTHVNFDGKCEEAFKFYEKVLGGKIEVLSRYESTPMAGQMPADWQNKIVHGRIVIAGSTLMAADPPPDRYVKPQGVTLSVRADSIDEAERIFKALSEGGTVGMPMTETFFANRFGMAVDRFGISWMVLNEKTA